MKYIFLFLAFVIFCSFAVDGPRVNLADPSTIGIILAAVYEIAARLVPTVKDYTILGKVIKGLKWLHLFFNNQKR